MSVAVDTLSSISILMGIVSRSIHQGFVVPELGHGPT